VDSSGNAYVTGQTVSLDFPTVNALYPALWGGWDAFITKIAPQDADGLYNLTVAPYADGGSGRLTSSPAGIDCGATCSHSFPAGATLTLTAVPNAGSVFSGWGGDCAGSAPTCTLTLDRNRNASGVFRTATPWQDPPERIDGGAVGEPAVPQTGAVVITHGWNATAVDWVEEIAQAICRTLSATQYYDNRHPDRLMPICSSNGWDVWTADWSTTAFLLSPFPRDAYVHAVNIGRSVADYFLTNHNYAYFHLIAHSAGSNLIEAAASRLKNSAQIHETFLDAFDPSDALSHYGENAEWADNYVDTRPLFYGAEDHTDLILNHAHNVDVTPATDGCNSIRVIDGTCRHSRPYRFYGLSISQGYIGNMTYAKVDPIAGTGGLGYLLSLEQGKTLDELNQQYPKGQQRVVVFTPKSVDAVLDDFYGEAQCQPQTWLCTRIRLGQLLNQGQARRAPAARTGTLAGGTSTPTEDPSWLLIQVTTTQPTNTLRFGWRFDEAGEGLVRVFVNEDLVGTVDQRHVPTVFDEPESLYIGERSPGTYRIAFRLDGFGANPSGVELTGVELGQEALQESNPVAYALSISKTGSGTVISDPVGIDCGSDCSEDYASGTLVTLTATPAAGSSFGGWGGACSGTGICTVSMTAARNVTATFTASTTTYSLNVSKTGSGSGTVTSSPAGINCGSTCSASFASGTRINLTVTPASGSSFGGWSGDCSGTGACAVSMTSARNVTATFAASTTIYPLNDTGITTCSDGTQNGLPCPVAGFPGQDAEYGTNGFDFTKLDANGNVLPASATNHTCVRDNVTGLIWEVKTNDGTLRDKGWTYTWYDPNAPGGNPGTASGGVCHDTGRCDTEKYAQDVNATGLCGFQDWRVPAVKELVGIVDYSISSPGPAINVGYFPNTPDGFLWSSSPIASSLDGIWGVVFHSALFDPGVVGGGYGAVHNAVQLVRGGQSFDSLTDNGNGTVTQNSTGLMWAQCSEGQNGADCATGSATWMTWTDALTTARNSRLGGYSDWRLPNIKELGSLVDYSRYGPSIDSNYFPNTSFPTDFWSSSPNAGNSDLAWVVIFDGGDFTNFTRSNIGVVRLVRDGFALTSTAGAKVFLDGNTIFALAASNATVDVYGNTGQETLIVPTGARSVSVDQNIERVDLAGLSSDYAYQQTGNILNVYSGGSLVFKAPVQSDADGTVMGFDTGLASARLTGAVMTLGGATVPTSAPGVVAPSLANGYPSVPTGSAKVFLEANAQFTLAAGNGPTSGYGNTGQETFIVPTGARSVNIDQNIEQITPGGLPSDYLYQQTGNILNVYSGGALVFKAPVQSDADGTVIGFDTGVASAQLAGGIMTLGGATVPSSAPGVVNPSLR